MKKTRKLLYSLTLAVQEYDVVHAPPRLAAPKEQSSANHRGPRRRRPVFSLQAVRATNRQPGAWQMLGKMIGESRETIARAVERGWVVVRDEAVGKVKVRSGMLPDEGRPVARRALRG